MSAPDDLAPDQRPEGWSRGAAGYETTFAGYTGAYADEALRLLGVGAGHRLLDVATGTGAVARRAAASGAAVLAVDFAPGMVEHLGRRAAAEGLDIEVAVMDGQALELADDSVDAAISMFGLIFFPDVEAGAAELARVTRPGGRVAIGTWQVDDFPLVELVGAGIAAAVPGFEPPAAEPSWARVGREDSVRELLESVGLVEVATPLVTRRWEMADPRAFFRSLPTWSPPVQPLFEVLDDAAIDVAADAFARALAARGDGTSLDVAAIIGVGRVP